MSPLFPLETDVRKGINSIKQFFNKFLVYFNDNLLLIQKNYGNFHIKDKPLMKYTKFILIHYEITLHKNKTKNINKEEIK